MFVVRPSNDRAGFTLLEIMVVVVIIGILMSMAVLSIGSRDREKVVHNEMIRVQGLFTLAAQEAIFGMQEWGVKFVGHDYQFLVLDEKNRWQRPAVAERLLKSRHLPDEISLTMQVEGEELAKEVRPDDPPQVIFSSDGEMTPFQLELAVADDHSESVRFRLTGSLNGRLRLERVSES